MDYRVCVTVEPTQYPHKSYIPLQNAKKNGVLQWNIVFVCLLSQLTTHTNRIFHRKTLKKLCCNGLPCLCGCWVNSIPTQIVYSNAKRKKNGVLQWNIVFVCLLSRLNTHTNRIFHCKTLKKWRFAMEYRVCVDVESTHYTHKSYIPLQNTKKMVFCNGLSCLCACWVYSTPTQIVYSIANR